MKKKVQRDGNDGPWSSFTLGIGTPSQFIRVFVSTTCPQPWAVLPQGCTPDDPSNCASTRGGLFYANKSTTWQSQGLYELDQELNLGYTGNGNFGFDTIALGYPGSGAYVIENQILAGIAAKDFYIATWGIAPRPTNLTTIDASDSHQSLMSTLKQNKQIPSLSYGYTAGAPYQLKKVFGSLTLGGYDASRFTPSNVSFGFAGDNSRDLVVGLQSIIMSSPKFNGNLLPNAILSFIDATVSHMWLPLEACQLFESAFGIEWDPLSDLYLVNDTLHKSLIAENASLTFKLGTDTTSTQTTEITLPYASFDLEVTTTYPNVTNDTSYFPLRRAANDTQYTLGRVFLQEAYLIADYERLNFSVHQCVFSESSQQDLRSIPSLNSTNGTNLILPQELHPRTSSKLSHGVIAAIVVSIAVVISILLYGIIIGCRRRRRPRTPSPNAPEELQNGDDSPRVEIEGEAKPKLELHGQSQPPSELQGKIKARPELEGVVAAHEMIAEPTTWHELP